MMILEVSVWILPPSITHFHYIVFYQVGGGKDENVRHYQYGCVGRGGLQFILQPGELRVAQFTNVPGVINIQVNAVQNNEFPALLSKAVIWFG